MATSVLAKILPKLGLPKPLPKVDTDFSDLEAQRVEMDERIEKMRATLNGEEGWMLCLTKDEGSCRGKDTDE